MSVAYTGDGITFADGTNIASGNTGLAKRFNEVFEYKDGDLFWKVTLSNAGKAGKQAGHLAHHYGTVRVDKVSYCIHKVIFCMFHGYMPEQVDHIDGNKKNHSIENLRSATNMTNSYNKPAQKNNKLNMKNICWSKQNKKWYVQLTQNRQKVVDVFVDDLELAQLVAMEARNKYHGAFANHGVTI